MSTHAVVGETPVAEEAPQGGDPRKRKQILAGADKVFMALGFNGASMGEIARVAGVSKGTLYVYFADKEQLFTACVEEKKRQFFEPLLNFGDRPIEEELTALGLGFSRFTASPEAVMAMRTVIGISEQMPAMGCRFYNQGPNSLISRFSLYLDRQVEQGRLAIADTRLAASQFLDLCQTTLAKPQLFGAQLSREEVEARSVIVVASAVAMFLAAYGRR